MESGQEVPEFLAQFKPELTPDAPLFEDDDDDDDDEDDEHESQKASAPSLAQGAIWDAGDNSVVFQGENLRTFPTLFSLSLHTCFNS